MPKLEIRYRWSFLDLEVRAEIFDGARWVRLSKAATKIQRQADALFQSTNAILAGMEHGN